MLETKFGTCHCAYWAVKTLKKVSLTVMDVRVWGCFEAMVPSTGLNLQHFQALLFYSENVFRCFMVQVENFVTGPETWSLSSELTNNYVVIHFKWNIELFMLLIDNHTFLNTQSTKLYHLSHILWTHEYFHAQRLEQMIWSLNKLLITTEWF